MNIRNLTAGIVAGLCFVAAGAFAESGTHTVIDGTNVSGYGGNYYVGYSGPNNTLEISGGGKLTNVLYGYIGYGSAANANSASVSGGGSEWRANSDMYVGYDGAGNSLNISSNGYMINVGAFVGFSASAGNNSVTVSASEWRSVLGLFIGYGSGGNSMSVLDGALVDSVYGTVGRTNANTAVVSGATWTNRNYLYVGYSGGGASTLHIDNGGAAYCTDFQVGIAAAADNNEVHVSGSGSVLASSGWLQVGNYGSGNSLILDSGGSARASTAIVGSGASASVNSVSVLSSAALNVAGNLKVGEYGGNNSLSISGGGIVRDDCCYVGIYSDGNSVTVSGADSIFTNSSVCGIGADGDGNSLEISAGAKMYTVDCYAGNGSYSNSIAVDGAGSALVARGSLYIGGNGSNNWLTVTDGATLVSRGAYIGLNSTARNNWMTISGAGTTWSNESTELDVGCQGSGNSLFITNGAAVFTRSAIIGWQLDDGWSGTVSTNNLLSISDSSLSVTNGAGTGKLEIRDGRLSFNGGSIVVDRLVATNPAARLVFGSGTLSVREAQFDTGSPFEFGNGPLAASYVLRGTRHEFAAGMHMWSNATVSGNGYISDVTVDGGATVSPGLSIGTIVMEDATLAAGAELDFEIASAVSCDRLVATNLTVAGAVTWHPVLTGGSLGGTYSLTIVEVGAYGAGSLTSGWLSLDGRTNLLDGQKFTISGAGGATGTVYITYTGGDGNDVVILSAPPRRGFRPQLTWSQTPGATWYNLWMSRNGVAYLNKWLNQSSTSWTPPSDLPGGGYSWQVRGWSSSNGYGAWSPALEFLVPTSTPATIALYEPAGVVITNKPVFSWAATDDTPWRQVQINRNGTLYQRTWTQAETNWTPASALPLGIYTWWVRGWNVNGYGAWSAPTGFTYGVCVPVEPVDFISDTRTPTFVWDGTPGVAWYQVWLKRNGTNVLSQWVNSSTSLLCRIDLQGGSFSWSVRGWTTLGYGPWSSTNFTIPVRVPYEAYDLMPTGIVATSVVGYNWSADSEATSYRLYVTRGGAKWLDRTYRTGMTNGTVTVTVSNHVAGTYKFWVQAMNPDGKAPWSAPATFQKP